LTIRIPKWGVQILALIVAVGVGIGLGALIFADDNDGGDKRTAAKHPAQEAGSQTKAASSPVAGSDEPGDCEELGINYKELKEGECTENGSTLVVINRDSTLKLPELNVRLLNIETTESVGGEFETENANGIFAVFTLEVKNKLHSPVTFDEGQEQVSLLVNENEYTEDFEAANGPLESSFLWIGEPIQPEATQTGDVIFDVPRSIARKIETEGNLNVLNFTDTGTYAPPEKALGVIRTYPAGKAG
jgi:hypothetical protein